MTPIQAAAGAAALALLAGAGAAHAADDRATVSALDVQYQAAVKANDAATMARILHPNMILALGAGQTATRDDLLQNARTRKFTYEFQDEEPGSQTVRLYGDTAIVTAKLHIKYASADQSGDRTLWFSDTYIRTPQGWRYAFGQASLALPPA